ncbi:CAH4 anhydrase, partial [Atractosteus spatula]|nr:CAH4 anhydrase [Atractosteus spatula]
MTGDALSHGFTAFQEQWTGMRQIQILPSGSLSDRSRPGPQSSPSPQSRPPRASWEPAGSVPPSVLTNAASRIVTPPHLRYRAFLKPATGLNRQIALLPEKVFTQELDSMDSLFAVLVILSLPTLARASEEWCYHDETCNDVVWAAKPIGKCDGQRQSPIDIVTANVTKNTSLTKFSFTGYNNRTKFRTIANIGHTVTLKLMEGVEIRGGGLSDTYVAQQFHLHWGNTSSGLGSEHTVDGRRYPMELHVVHLKKGYDLHQAQNDPEGIAVLGFLIEATNGTQTPESWRVLTSHLRNISEKDQSLDLSLRLSLNDLLSGVDRSKYYRYKGSLTTPNCSEAVVWTVFQQPLRLSRDLTHTHTVTPDPRTANTHTPLHQTPALRTHTHTVTPDPRTVNTHTPTLLHTYKYMQTPRHTHTQCKHTVTHTVGYTHTPVHQTHTLCLCVCTDM